MNCSRVLSMTNPALSDELKTLVEPGTVLTDADSLNAYGKGAAMGVDAGRRRVVGRLGLSQRQQPDGR